MERQSCFIIFRSYVKGGENGHTLPIFSLDHTVRLSRSYRMSRFLNEPNGYTRDAAARSAATGCRDTACGRRWICEPDAHWRDDDAGTGARHEAVRAGWRAWWPGHSEDTHQVMLR